MNAIVISNAKRWGLVTLSFGIASLTLLPLGGLLLGFLELPGTYPSYLAESYTLVQLIQQKGLTKLIFNTLSLAMIVSTFAVFIGTWLAWVEQRTSYWGAKWLGRLDLLPLAMPSYILAVVLREAIGPGGFLGSFFHWPLFRGFIPAVIVLTIITVPYVKLLVFSVLTRLSAAEEDVAYCLGASKGRVFREVILPRLRPSIALSWLMCLLYVISDFGAVAILDLPVLTWRLYQAVESQQLANAALMGTVIVLLTIPLFFIARWLHGYRSSSIIMPVSNPRLPKRVPLSWYGQLMTYGLHSILIGVGVMLPVYVLCVWVFHGLINHIAFADIFLPLKDTAYIAFFSSLGIVFLAIFPAWVVARRFISAAMILEKAVFLTSSLPGILLAFGLMLAALFFARLFAASSMIYQWLLASGILLFLGYTMRFLAEAYACIKNAILLFDPRLSESAQLLNVSRWRYLSQVVIPSLAPGLKIAFLLSLLAIIKELPVTLLLGNAMGIRTLSFRIYDRYHEAFLHDVGAAGLVLLILSLGLVVITLRWREHA